MNDFNAFAAQDGADYGAWLDFIHEDIDLISLPVLTQMQADLKDAIIKRRTSDINEIEQGMIDVVRPTYNEPF